jgi:hypothetical protein
MRVLLHWALAVGTLSAALAQEAPGQAGVRELFYAGVAPVEKLPPIRKKIPSTSSNAPPRNAARDAGAARRPAAPPQPPASNDSLVVPAVDTGARNLGLRYNLVLVDQKTAHSQTVSSARNFAKGECFAIDIEANRSGYLYVLAKQSSGDWMPLFPSPRMTGESNVINPGQKVRVPARYCFEIADPPGSEKLFVALVRDPGEVTDLHEGIGATPAEDAPPAKPGTTLMASAHLVNDAVARMSATSISRDIVIREVSQPADSREVAHSVYVVHASAKPASKVVVEILVHHR